MASTKRVNVVPKLPITSVPDNIKQELKAEKKLEKEKYDFINPSHYVQDDGRQTWEHMVDKWGEEKTALWCEMTAFKYQDRIGRKPGEDEEREKNKIKWYEDKAEELRTLAKKKKFW